MEASDAAENQLTTANGKSKKQANQVGLKQKPRIVQELASKNGNDQIKIVGEQIRKTKD